MQVRELELQHFVRLYTIKWRLIRSGNITVHSQQTLEHRQPTWTNVTSTVYNIFLYTADSKNKLRKIAFQWQCYLGTPSWIFRREVGEESGKKEGTVQYFVQYAMKTVTSHISCGWFTKLTSSISVKFTPMVKTSHHQFTVATLTSHSPKVAAIRLVWAWLLWKERLLWQTYIYL